ncbi:MAG: tetratricopeptide repeat protein [Leptospirales bacterium]|nr:tetratricopeptide repeat protein [Leptospirales bacterium]
MKQKKIKPLLTFLFIILYAQTAFANNYARAVSLYQSKRYEKAKETFLKVIKTHENGNALYYLGEIEKIEGKYKEAKEYFKRAVKAKAINISNLKSAYWNIASIEEQWGEYENLALTYHEIWNKMKDEAARQKIDGLINKLQWSKNSNAVSEYNKGIEMKRLSKTEEAASHFKEALKNDPLFIAPKFELGILAVQSGDMDAAEANLSPVVSKIPFYAEANIALGDVYFNKRKFSSAHSCFERAVKFGFLNSQTRYHINIRKAQCYYHEGSFAKAEESALAAASLAPEQIEPLTLISAACIKQKNLEKAIDILQKAQNIQPNNTDVLYQLGGIYYSKKDERYLANFDKLFNLTKEKPKPPYPRIIPIIVNAHYKQKNYDRVNEILATLPEEQNSELAVIKAKSFYYTSQYDKAITLFRGVSAIANEDKLLLASAYARTRQNDRATDVLQPLMDNAELKAKALRDQFLAPLAREIERKNLGQQKQTEQEKLEQERRAKQRETERQAEKDRIERDRLERERQSPAHENTQNQSEKS